METTIEVSPSSAPTTIGVLHLLAFGQSKGHSTTTRRRHRRVPSRETGSLCGSGAAGSITICPIDDVGQGLPVQIGAQVVAEEVDPPMLPPVAAAGDMRGD